MPSSELAAAGISVVRPGADTPYRLQVGDVLDVRFPFQPEMNSKVPVRPDGRITLEPTGEIKAAGLTPTELEELICQRSSSRLRNPEVRVIVTRVGEQRVYVGGEVNRPGYVALRRGMTPLQAVLERGGFRPTARLDSVLLLGRLSNGEFRASRMNLEQVVEEGVPERIRLRPNDVIYVPRTRIANVDLFVDQYVRGLIPSLPRVGAGYNLSQ